LCRRFQIEAIIIVAFFCLCDKFGNGMVYSMHMHEFIVWVVVVLAAACGGDA